MRDRIERAFTAWGHLVYGRAGRTIAAVGLAVLALASQLPKLEIETSTESFLEEDHEIRLTYDAFRARFGRDERILLAIEPPAIFDLAFLEKLRALHEEIESEVPKLQEVTSLINARYTRGEGDELIVEDLLEEWPQTDEDLAALERRMSENPLYANVVISEDLRVTTITIETDAYSSLDGDAADELAGFEDLAGDERAPALPRRFLTGAENAQIVDALEAIVARHSAPDFPIHVAGTPVMVDHLQRSLRADMSRFTALALGTIALLLWLLFRRLAGVLLPLLVGALSAVCTLGWMAATGIAISLPAQILPSFLLAVSVGNSAHLLVIFYQSRARGESEEQALAFALGHSGLAIVMTGLTTAGGLLSFAAAELAPIAEFGVAAPTGAIFALLLSLILLPALIAVLPTGGAAKASALDLRTRRLLVRLGDLGTAHAPVIVLASAGLVAIASLGAAQIRFSHNPLTWFPADDYFRRSTEFMNDAMRGAMYLEVLVDTGEENGLHDPHRLNRMDEMQRFAGELQRGDVFVGKSMSLVDVVKEIHQALNEGRPEFHAIPQDRRLVAQELLLFESSGSDDLEDVVDPQFSLGRFTMKLPWIDALQYGPFQRALEAGFAPILGEDTEFTFTGLMALVGGTFEALIYSMAYTYVMAFLVITPLMILLIGNLRIGLVSMVPNLAPIVITLGFMGWLGIPLDAFTLLIGSIAIGLAVDDTIHFMHNFRRYFGRSGNVRSAVGETLSSTGQALLFTTLTLSTGFFTYMLSSMKNLFYFGLLTGFTILMALLADLILAPALMALVMRRQPAPAPSRGKVEVPR